MTIERVLGYFFLLAELIVIARAIVWLLCFGVSYIALTKLGYDGCFPLWATAAIAGSALMAVLAIIVTAIRGK
jgi:hypothetical protein